MSKATVLNNVDHKDVKVNNQPSLYKNEHVNRSMIYVTEIGELHKEFPLVFYKNPNTDSDKGQLQLHAILGLEKDENLFLGENGWNSRFVPALLARGPFSLGYKKAESDDSEQAAPVICIDMQDSRVNTEQGEDIFLQYGGEAPYLSYVKKALQTIENGITFNKTLYTLVEELDLLEPVSIQIKLSNIEEVNFNDYYTVNQKKLAQLDGEKLAKLNQYGVLSLLYFVLSSMGNFQQLTELKNAKSAMF
ncbi:SapC family protein [Paraglaciecola sp. MB-3u-78]|uniref:SapC family protein n=1 Tax=Paraglaciecola sp. MB-3u-78 TaxID=2058332 RepID=UPI000C32C4DC|nr:SapC family protein [Paraglaciecola sp. MB-3u-78]PKG98054.1 peptide ABC transporter permease [Paraglaciecola sp. MB-3u-78]